MSVANKNAIYSDGKQPSNTWKIWAWIPPRPYKKITIVDSLGASQILFIGRDPIPSLIRSFFSRKLTIYNGQHVQRKYKPN